MNLEQIQDILNNQLLILDNRCLSNTELLVLRGILQNQTYSEVALREGYSSSYLANVVAPELYRRLSKITGQRITKKNCRAVLESYLTQKTASVTNIDASYYPCGSVSLNSPFYLKSPLLESQIIDTLSQPGG